MSEFQRKNWSILSWKIQINSGNGDGVIGVAERELLAAFSCIILILILIHKNLKQFQIVFDRIEHSKNENNYDLNISGHFIFL
jgi:hypothetical protein